MKIKLNWKKIGLMTVDIICNTIITVFSLLCLWIFASIFIYATFTIPTDSMLPVIQPVDKVIVDKVSTGGRLFDIVAASRGEIQ